MTETSVHVGGHYEVEETPFVRAYKWHPGYVTLKCNCGMELTLFGASTTAVCSRCGTDHSGVIIDIQTREDLLKQETTHPWNYDTQEQTEQHQKDEAAHAEDSAWRYNDVTSHSAKESSTNKLVFH